MTSNSKINSNSINTDSEQVYCNELWVNKNMLRTIQATAAAPVCSADLRHGCTHSDSIPVNINTKLEKAAARWNLQIKAEYCADCGLSFRIRSLTDTPATKVDVWIEKNRIHTVMRVTFPPRDEDHWQGCPAWLRHVLKAVGTQFKLSDLIVPVFAEETVAWARLFLKDLAEPTDVHQPKTVVVRYQLDLPAFRPYPIRMRQPSTRGIDLP